VAEDHLQVGERCRRGGAQERCGLVFEDRRTLTVGRVQWQRTTSPWFELARIATPYAPALA
jgi:hypothetical protein